MFETALFALSAVAGAIAALSGFGIGSLLTPALALRFGTQAAVAIVTVPHLAATALRAWRLRDAISWPVLRSFGLASALGGLAGALLHGRLGSRALTFILGALLVLAGLGSLTGFLSRLRLRGAGRVLGGVLSGAFGGLVGNQGGIRSAALLTLDLGPRAFVATATATGLLVDGARLPVYVATNAADLAAARIEIAIALAGVLAGTIWGERVLRRLPEPVFRRVVAVLLLALGVALVLTALH